MIATISTILASEHSFARTTRVDGRMRMECSCGELGRWTESPYLVREAQDRHADKVAGA